MMKKAKIKIKEFNESSPFEGKYFTDGNKHCFIFPCENDYFKFELSPEGIRVVRKGEHEYEMNLVKGETTRIVMSKPLNGFFSVTTRAMEVMAHGNAVTACAEFYLDEENFRRLEIECEII